jgi:hypothetical protein
LLHFRSERCGATHQVPIDIWSLGRTGPITAIPIKSVFGRRVHSDWSPNSVGDAAVEKLFLSRALSSRRRFLGGAGAATLALASVPALADAMVKLSLPGGPDERPMTSGLSSEGSAHPAAHPAAAARNADRRVRSIGLHAERPVLRALAFGGYPDRSRCRYLPVGGARPRQSDAVAVAR